MQYLDRKHLYTMTMKIYTPGLFKPKQKNTHSALFANLKASSPYHNVKHFMVIWFTKWLF